VLSESFDRIEATLGQLQGRQSPDVIQLTSTPSFASKWLVPRLSDWYRYQDASRIHLLPSLDNLELGGEIDFAIRCGIPPWGDYQHELLMPIHLVPVCSPEYAAQSAPISDPADCLAHPLIHADIDSQPAGQEWRDWLSACEVDFAEPLDGLSVKDPALAMQAAADGLGLAMGYFELIDRDLQAGRLVCANEHRVKHDFSYYLVRSRSLKEDSPQARFRRWLADQL
jgi:LysR family glycine cleavage system transcriptional activator